MWQARGEPENVNKSRIDQWGVWVAARFGFLRLKMSISTAKDFQNLKLNSKAASQSNMGAYEGV